VDVVDDDQPKGRRRLQCYRQKNSGVVGITDDVHQKSF
jgi:hypothetical protein